MKSRKKNGFTNLVNCRRNFPKRLAPCHVKVLSFKFYKTIYSIFTFTLELVQMRADWCSNTGPIRDDPYLTSGKNSLELIELSSINKVSLV